MRKIESFGKSAVLATVILALMLPTTSALAEEAAPVPAAEPTAESAAEPAVVDGDAAIPVGDEGNDPAADSAVSRQTRIAAETVHAFGSRKSNDWLGYEPSLYQGKWHMPKREKLRKCISKAESRHNYRAGRGGFYRGAYQFSPALSVVFTCMTQPQVRQEMVKAVLRLVNKLRKKTKNISNRYSHTRTCTTI